MVDQLIARYLDAGEGTRLPPERLLAAEFGVSRAEIRKALARLELDGHLSREIGRGTFVRTPPADPGASALADLATLKRNTSPREVMEARLLLEPELASLAAVNATSGQIEHMHELAARMRRADNWKDYEQEDGELHRLIATSTGNTLLAAIHRGLDEVRRTVVWKWLDTRPSGPPADYSSFAEHDALIDAIERHDRAGAEAAMRRHLFTTSDKLIGGRV